MGAILLYDTICKMSTGRKHPADILLWKKEKYEKKESFPLMKNPLNEKKPNGLALIPFVIFIAIYMGAGVYYQVKGTEMAFYQFPSVTAMFLAVLAAFIMFKGTINEKFDVFAKGAANVDILTMLMIYILAGAFASVAANMGGRESTVNLGLSLVPVQFLAAGLFVISAFMGTATGSSMGTVSAVIDAQNGEITVTADTQDVGRGGSLDAALSDLRAGCAGTLFTQTAEHVVLTQKAWFLMPQVCVSAQLRPAAKLYRAVGQSISAERALSFLQAHPGELTLSRARAALLENKEVQAAVLVQTGGGFRLGG
mgnify:CR=1 FL=1